MSNTNLPSVRRFYSEDYKDAPQWFQRFLQQLNLYSDPIYSILNAGIDITQNTLWEIYTYSIANSSQIPSSNAFTFTPKKFVGTPQAVLPAQILLTSNNGMHSTYFLTAPNFDWNWTGSQINISAVYGLIPSQTYSISLLIM